MSTQPKPKSTIGDVQEICVDFGLPLVILAMLFSLLMTGIDGEVKTLMAGVIGWITKSGVSRARRK